MDKKLVKALSQTKDTDTRQQLLQAEAVKQLLEYCMQQPGADIQIIINHDSGQKAVAKLYDHAALVSGLWEAISYFQSEMSTEYTKQEVSDLYMVDCLKSAISYCKQQFEESEVDWLPSVNFIGQQDEAIKFEMLTDFLNNL